MPETKLRPCPFCGKPAGMVISRQFNGNEIAHRVWCPACGAGGPIADSPQEAVEKWNGVDAPAPNHTPWTIRQVSDKSVLKSAPDEEKQRHDQEAERLLAEFYKKLQEKGN